MNHPHRNWRRRLAAEASALGPDLVSAYIALHRGPTAAARALSEDTGRPYSANLLCRWRRGEAPTPVAAQQAMRYSLLLALLGGSARPVAAVLSPP